MMSPLFIVGITLLTTVLGDVSHVLQEQAHPPADPQDINNAFTSKDLKDFWWMRDDSPLKASYDYFKKCAATGKCASDKSKAQFNGDDDDSAPINVKKNVFLNGNFAASSVSKSALSAGNSSEPKSFHSGAKVDFSNNPFLQGGFAHAANGDLIRNENGFIGVQPSVPFKSLKKNGYQTSAVSGSATSSSSQACNGSDRTCVPKEDCSNGVVLATATIKNISHRCAENQVCCRLPSGGKSSVADHINQLLFIPGKSKLTGKDGLTPEQVQIIHTSQEGIRPQINLIGEFVGSSTVKPVRDLSASANSPVFSSTPDYSNYNFGDSARDSDFDGPDYLPPDKPATCPPGQFVGSFGRCEPKRPECPSGSRPTPSGGCEVLKCPPGEQLGPYGRCIPIPTPPPPPPPTCPPGQKLGPYGSCVPISTPPPPPPPLVCPPGQKPGPYGGCVSKPIPPPLPPTTTPPPYCPSGHREGPNGVCIPVITIKPSPSGPYCATGEKLVNGKCVTVCGSGQRPTQFGTCEDIIVTPPSPYCPSGYKKDSHGGCIQIITTPAPYCASGEKLVNGKCVTICGPGEKPTLIGTCEPTGPPITPPPPPPSCPPGQKRGPYGECVPISIPPPAPYCANGEKLVNGKCVTICGPGEKPTLIGTCEPTGPPITPPPPPPSCPPGQKRGPYGKCVPISIPPPAPYCASGEKLVNGKCVTICGPGEKPTLIGTCERFPPPPQGDCPPDKKLVNRECISITPHPPSPPPCPPGEQRNPFGECVKPQPPTKTCRPGYELNRYGNCEKTPRPGPYCPSGQREVNGACVAVEKCRPGEESGPFGCRRKQCPPGSVLSSAGNCESSPQPPRNCLPGTIKTPSGRCEPTPSPPPPPCPPGSSLGPHGCVKPPTSYLPPETTTPKFRDGEEFNDDYNPEADSTRISILKTTPPPRRRENDTIIPDELIPVGCAAALKCVQEIYCTADGFVSPVPVVLTKEQELLKAPTTVCRDIESGTLGKCCRDRDYQDPWPSANLVNGVDDGQYAEDDSIGQYKVQYNRISRSSARRTKRATGECGTRHLNSNPRGQVPIDADFAEISWQAMILRDSNRSLLCGGAIIRRNAVLTAAHCVEGLQTSDVLIKGGEWKLGIDEEPLPFQIVKVAAILRHPDFKAGSLQNDLAVLVLEENLRFAKNIEQICLPQPNLIPTQNCIATGWGKRILQLHAKNALMHRIDVNVMDVEQCQQVMGQYFQKLLPNYNTNTLCGFSDIDQCKVDYGSALACADESGRYTLSGIYSWDTGCKQQGQIGGYVAPDVEWVETVLSTPLKQLKRLDRLYNSARVQ